MLLVDGKVWVMNLPAMQKQRQCDLTEKPWTSNKLKLDRTLKAAQELCLHGSFAFHKWNICIFEYENNNFSTKTNNHRKVSLIWLIIFFCNMKTELTKSYNLFWTTDTPYLRRSLLRYYTHRIFLFLLQIYAYSTFKMSVSYQFLKFSYSPLSFPRCCFCHLAVKSKKSII